MATRTSAPLTMSLVDSVRADVAVIGAGILGCTAALRLAQRGVSVVLLEADEVGFGATGRSGGFVVPNFAKVDPQGVIEALGVDQGERLLSLIGGAANQVFSLVREHAISCDAGQGGWIQPAHTQRGAALIKQRAEQWERRGKRVRILDAKATAALTGCHGYLGAWVDCEGGTIHPLNYVDGLARAAQARGVRIFTHSAVTAITRNGGPWRLQANAHEVTAEKVLLCTNAFSIAGEFAATQASMGRSLIGLDIHQVATDRLPDSARAHLLQNGQCMSDIRNDLFTYRLTADGRLISGGMAITSLGTDRRMGRRIVDRLARMLMLKTTPKAEFIWTGRAAITRDFMPKLHELAPGFLAGIGCNGRGIATTTVLGPVMADYVCGLAEAELPIPIARVQRFAVPAARGVLTRAALALGRYRDFIAPTRSAKNP
jgi:glycine/D-amino acid oxidase-like deaminating enzyme